MSFLIFKLGLPLLLGYTLFVGLSGRFIPFTKPAELSARPSWFLGLWMGITLALVTGVALHMSMQVPVDRLSVLAKPTGILLAGLSIVGLFGFFLYRRDVADELHYQTHLNRTADEITAIGFVEIEPTEQLEMAILSSAMADNSEFDDTVNSGFAEELVVTEHQTKQDFVMPEVDYSEASEDLVNSGDLGSVSLLFDRVSTPSSPVEEVAPKEEESASVASNLAELNLEKTIAVKLELAEAKTELYETQTELSVIQSELTGKQTELSDAKSELKTKHSKLTETQSKLIDKQTELTERHSDNAKLTTQIEQLTRKLASESQLRDQTETHLRITRKALKTLEGDVRDFEIEKANAVIAVEVQLESHVKETASSKARANREESKRVEAQNKVVDLTQDLLQSKRELRQSTEARARALSAANKSVAFARKNVQARSRAEARVKLLESRLKLSQQALKSRNAALSSDKRFKEEVSSRIKRKLIRHRENVED